MFYKAIELDPNLALAHGRAAVCYMWSASNGWLSDQASGTAEAIRLARRVVELDKDEALALSWAGMALSFSVPDTEEEGLA